MTLPNLNYLAYQGWKFRLTLDSGESGLILCNWEKPKKINIAVNGSYDLAVTIPNGRFLHDLRTFTLKIMVHGKYYGLKFKNSGDSVFSGTSYDDYHNLYFQMHYGNNSTELIYQAEVMGSEDILPDENKPILFQIN